jgi:hypothetical protein
MSYHLSNVGFYSIMKVIISRIKTYYQSYWSKVQSKQCKPMPLSKMPGEGSNLWLYDYEGYCISSILEIIKGHYGGIFLSLGRNILVISSIESVCIC